MSINNYDQLYAQQKALQSTCPIGVICKDFSDFNNFLSLLEPSQYPFFSPIFDTMNVRGRSYSAIISFNKTIKDYDQVFYLANQRSSANK